MPSSWLKIVAPIVRQAGEAARRKQKRGVTAEQKEHGEWVTETDRETESFIIERLRYYFPDHGMLGEESGHHGDSENCWVIDPIDGTTNFIHGFPHSVVSVAFCHNGKPEVGVIYDIATDDTYAAVIGGGAYLNDERIRVSAVTQFSRSLLCASGQLRDGDTDLWQHIVALGKSTEGMRRTGSSALDLVQLAAGFTDVVVSGPVKFWDVAAGSLIVREAGGLISDVNDNTEFKFNEKTASFVASSPRVFARFFTETKNYCRKQSDAAAASTAKQTS